MTCHLDNICLIFCMKPTWWLSLMCISIYLLSVTLAHSLSSSVSPTPFAPLPTSLFVKVETEVTGSLNCQTSKSLLNIWHLTVLSPSPSSSPSARLHGHSLTEITISGRINEAYFLLNLLPPTHGSTVYPRAGRHSTRDFSLLTSGWRRWAGCGRRLFIHQAEIVEFFEPEKDPTQSLIWTLSLYRWRSGGWEEFIDWSQS